MLSGYLTLNKEITIKETVIGRVSRVVFMKIVSIILCIITGGIYFFIRGLSVREGVINALSNWGYGTSYLAVLAGCYLCSPIIYRFLQEKRNEEYFLILSAIFGLIIPLFVDLDYIKDVVPSYIISIMNWMDYGEVFIPVGAMSLFVLGHYLGRITENTSKLKAVMWLVVSFGIWELVSIWQAANLGSNNIISALRYGRYYGSYVSPFIIVYSSAIFVFFKVVLGQVYFQGRLKKCIEQIGKNTVWIFLLHGIVISIVRPYIPVFWTKSFLVETIVDVSLYFIIAYLISLVLEHIPILNKIR